MIHERWFLHSDNRFFICFLWLSRLVPLFIYVLVKCIQKSDVNDRDVGRFVCSVCKVFRHVQIWISDDCMIYITIRSLIFLAVTFLFFVLYIPSRFFVLYISLPSLRAATFLRLVIVDIKVSLVCQILDGSLTWKIAFSFWYCFVRLLVFPFLVVQFLQV